MTVLVLGIGNVLLSDEGIGVRAVEALEDNYVIPRGVDVVDGGTCGMELLEKLANREHVIIVDAVKAGRDPGTIVRLTGDEVPAFFRTKLSPHQVGLSDVLAALRLTDELPENIILFGVQPASMETRLELSSTVAAELPRLVDLVAQELATLGFDTHKRPADAEPPAARAF